MTSKRSYRSCFVRGSVFKAESGNHYCRLNVSDHHVDIQPGFWIEVVELSALTEAQAEAQKNQAGLINQIKLRDEDLDTKTKIIEAERKLRFEAQAEVTRLENIIRASNIDANSMEEKISEATHYTWLDDQNEQFKRRVDKLEKTLQQIEKLLIDAVDLNNVRTCLPIINKVLNK